jgi:DNA-binding CsgD family transcriptional regulator
MSYLPFVPSGTFLGPNDLDSALAVVAEAASIDGEQPFELPVIERLLDLIPADRAGYFEYRRPSDDIYSVEISYPGPGIDWLSEQVQAIVKWWPLRDDLWCGAEQAVRDRDLMTRRQWLRNPWYMDGPSRVREHEMKVWLPAPEGVVRGFWFDRDAGGGDFAERDRDVLTVLRPYLAAVRERWDGRHLPVLLLTRREREILQLVREGLTNREVAARLVISAGTVRSHLENIFEKLNVHTRTAAVACAFDAHTWIREDIEESPTALVV